MSTHDTRKPSFDAILSGIRTDEPTRVEIDAAASRARAALGFDAPAASASAVHIESCAGFQALIPDYLAGRLPRPTEVLLADHSRECIPCRRALIAARTPKTVPAAVPAAKRPAYLAWAASAAASAALLLAGYGAWQVLPGFGQPPQLKVMRVEGALYQVRGGTTVPLRPGMTIPATEIVRTGKGSGALLQLDDGSRIEMRDRTELAVRRGHGDATVTLGNGGIIVEASPQGSGHLDVRTEDCLVSVKGTIFAVSRGTKGSRVSVVEGSVRVDTGGRQRLLAPGDQVATTDAVTEIPVADEIAWSQDAQRYGQLLRELAALRQDLAARVPNPKLRYASTLLERVPGGTVVYVAIPNLTESLVEAKKVLTERIAESPALQSWWNEHMTSPDHQKEFDEAFERMRALGSQLGDEIVVTMGLRSDGEPRGPVVMAEVKDAQAFAALLADLPGNGVRDVTVSFDGPVVTLTPRLDASAGSRGSTQPLSAAFRDKLAQAYTAGVSWVFGANLKSILAHAERTSAGTDPKAAEALDRSGMRDVQYVVATRSDDGATATNRAEIDFDQARRGVAGWLAAPAPLGALDFVSPDAAFAAAAVVKRPELLLADVLSWACPDAAHLNGPLSEADAQLVLDELRDLAGALGGDFAVALDGPVLPVPSWKVAIEAYDAARAQAAIERLVGFVNDRIASSGGTGRISLSSEDVGNRIDQVVRFTGTNAGEPATMRYTFTEGYLVAAPTKALLDLTLEQRGNGYRLAASKAFTDQLPTDGHVDVSAVVWQHLGPTLGPFLSAVSSTVAVDDGKQLASTLAGAHPSLLTAYAENDRIVIGSRDQAGLGAMIGTIVSANTLGDLGRFAELARHASHEGATKAR